MKQVKNYKSHKNGLFKPVKNNNNKQKLINTSKINFIYILNSANKDGRLQTQCVGFQDLIFILNCARLSEIFMSKGTMFHIFGPRYLSALKPQLTVFTDPN